MPDNDPRQNAPHLEQRLAVTTGNTDDGARFDNWGGAKVPEAARTMHQVWAGEYVRLLAEGDTGAAFSHLHHLRYEEPDADPWRLLEYAVRRALAHRGVTAATGQETVSPAGESASVVPPAAAAAN